jgi:transposase InsO family protein
MSLNDNTLTRNYIRQIKGLIAEYELIKSRKHPRFQFVSEFYSANNIKKQNFIKYYNRFKLGLTDSSLIPQKRGRKFGNMKYQPYICNKIEELRNQGFGRFEIHDLMLPRYGKLTPSPTTIYNILLRKGLNKLDPRMISLNKRKIIKETAGELGHMDCHVLAKGIISGDNTNKYLVTLTDDFTRLAFSIVLTNIQAITVTFATQKLLAIFYTCYNIQFQEIRADNGSEFGRKTTKEETKLKHPFEAMLIDQGIKHRYTRPYRPQTNGKCERNWRSIEEELLRDQIYPDQPALEEEIFEYYIYFNHIRRHQGINNITPYQKLNSVIE